MSHMRAAAVAPLLVVSALLLGGWKASAQAEDLSPGQTKTLAAGGERSSLLASSPETQGDVLVARGNYAAALDAYQQAWPRTAVTWNKVGVAYHHLFALDEALKSYKQALVIDPRYASAYNNLGAVYHGKREFALAEKAYKRAIKYEPRIAISYCNLGTTYFAESKYKKGIKAYRQALELDPDVFNPDRRAQIEESSSREQRVAIAYSLAEAYAGAGRTNEALASLRKAFASGFSDRKRLMEDKELASLRKTTEFHQLLVEEQME